MRYDILRTAGNLTKGSPVSFFVIPVSSDPLDYFILKPRLADRRLFALATEGRLVIRSYTAVSPDAVEEIHDEVREVVETRTTKQLNRGRTLFMSGIGLACVGIASWFVPDPLIAVDEIFCVLGGAGLAWWGARLRKGGRYAPVPANAGDVAKAVPVVHNRLLDRVHEALRLRKELRSADTGVLADRAEELSAALDMRGAAGAGDLSEVELRPVFRALSRLVPFTRILAIRDKTGDAARRKLGRIHERLYARHGLSADAVSVYVDLYVSLWGRRR